jgi:hypothetical protein
MALLAMENALEALLVLGHARRESRGTDCRSTSRNCEGQYRLPPNQDLHRRDQVDSGRSISLDEGCRRVELTGSKLLSGTVDRLQAFRTACGGFVTDSGPSRAALVDLDFAQLRPARSRVGKMSRTRSVLGIALGRWCRLGQTHYPVLGDKGPRESMIPVKRRAGARRPSMPIALRGRFAA